MAVPGPTSLPLPPTPSLLKPKVSPCPRWGPDLWGTRHLSQPASQRWAKTKQSFTKLPGECWRIAPRCCLSYYSGFSGRLINLLAREPHGDEGFSHQLGYKTPVPHRPCILGRNPGCPAGNTGPWNTSCTPNGGTRDWQGDCKEGAVGLHQCQAILLSPVTDQNQPQIRKC